MGRRGPPKQPAALKVLKGTYRPDRDGPTEALFEPGVEPPALVTGNPRALGEWERLGPKLEELGLLTMADRALFSVYCVTWGQWEQISEELAERGELVAEIGAKGYRQELPEFSVQKKLWSMLKETAARFGFSPADRASLGLTEGELSHDPFFDGPDLTDASERQ
jgi:P27 family predicted phage terminase small subunit